MLFASLTYRDKSALLAMMGDMTLKPHDPRLTLSETVAFPEAIGVLLYHKPYAMSLSRRLWLSLTKQAFLEPRCTKRFILSQEAICNC